MSDIYVVWWQKWWEIVNIVYESTVQWWWWKWWRFWREMFLKWWHFYDLSSPLLSSPLLSSPLLSSQLLYSTYLFSSARKSLGVDEDTRREVYDQIMPAFEELFDKVEDHTLNILLEPWTLLVSRDKESSQKVTTVHNQYNSLPFYLEKAGVVGQSTMGLKNFCLLFVSMLIFFSTYMYKMLKNGQKKKLISINNVLKCLVHVSNIVSFL